MIKRILYVESHQFNPHQNLALEEALFDFVDEETLIFYLWQNQHTVVIGQNQNATKECHVVQLEQDKGILARRLSGGGAVYHDLGNLNFTFLMSSDNFNLQKQNEVLLNALSKLGIDAYAHGRNDLLIEGKKFSGHAYYHHHQKSYHHGTLMVDVDFSQLSKYLNVSKAKLQGKGVNSVVSRVSNLSEYQPNLTIEALKLALVEAVQEVYQQSLKPIDHYPDYSSLVKKYSNEQWLMNPKFNASYETSNRFDWGEINILLNLENHRIKEVEVYTDAMDTSIVEKLKACLIDELFTIESIKAAINSCGIYPQDLISLFEIEENPFL